MAISSKFIRYTRITEFYCKWHVVNNFVLQQYFHGQMIKNGLSHWTVNCHMLHWNGNNAYCCHVHDVTSIHYWLHHTRGILKSVIQWCLFAGKWLTVPAGLPLCTRDPAQPWLRLVTYYNIFSWNCNMVQYYVILCKEILKGFYHT